MLIVVPALIGGLLSLMHIQEPKGALFLVLGLLAGIILFVSLGCLDLVRCLGSLITKLKPSCATDSESRRVIERQRPTSQPAVPTLTHGRFQYALRTLAVFVTLCAIMCGWLVVEIQQARREREVARAIEESGGYVEWYDDENWNRSTPVGSLVRRLLGHELFMHVRTVGFVGSKITDNSLESLKGLSDVQTLKLYAPNITDRGLENIEGLSQLKELILWKGKITHEGVTKLQQALPTCIIKNEQ